VIQQTIREQLPEGFQKAEYLFAHGMVDMVVHRHALRETLARLCRLLRAQAAPLRASKPVAARSAERGYLNGNGVDGKTIETLARSPDVIDAEALPGEEPFDAPPENSKREGEPKTRPGSRDIART
jgi:acetyl-CoA carboxylase carboxyl transferase subunit beta